MENEKKKNQNTKNIMAGGHGVSSAPMAFAFNIQGS